MKIPFFLLLFCFIAIFINPIYGSMISSPEIQGFEADSFNFDSLNVRFVGNWPFGFAWVVENDSLNNLLFCSSGGGVYIFDVSIPNNPVKISEKIQIHGGAPLLILLFLCMILTLFLLITKIPTKTLILYWLILSMFPISSLIPFKFIFETDGYCILKDTKRLKISKLKLIRELLYGIFYGLRYIFLGSVHMRKSNIEEVNTRVENAFKWVQKGKFENALTELKEELKNNNNDPDLYNNIAWCYVKLGIELDKAITFAHKATKLNPGEPTYQDTLGWCYFKKGDIDNAKHFLTKAILIDPYNLVFQKHLKEIEKVTSKT